MMTKAKKRTAKVKSRRVWIVLNADGRVAWDVHYVTRKEALDACLRSWYGSDIARATLTWYKPAPKAKKRSAR